MVVKGKYNEAKIFTDNVDDTTVSQVENLLNQKFTKGSKIRIMPDCHAGMGCVIGFTADLGDKIVPNLVGVDIGCGMLTVELGKVDIDLAKFDDIVKRRIPSGKDIHRRKKFSYPDIQNIHIYRSLRNKDRFEKSIGTLGGGNHFIELGQCDNGEVFLVIHTGSRNLGHQIASIYQNKAIQSCKQDPEKRDYPRDLCYLEGKLAQEYLDDMKIAQEYASYNREKIAELILGGYFKKRLSDYNSWETIHNYIDHETMIVRKGAISAKDGERVLIPLNMRDGSLIGIGKGNEDWNFSAPHGAGRVLSRTQARGELCIDEFKDSMEGVYTSTLGPRTLDEAPMAYKPKEEIKRNIRDTVDLTHHIRPIYNFKG